MGGNVFDYSKPIPKENIKPTLLEFFKELSRVFPRAKSYFSNMATLGSVGKKPVSGDIDLALDSSSFERLEDWGLDSEYIQQLYEKFKKRARTATDNQLMNRAFITAMGEKIQDSSKMLNVDLKSSGAGSIFFIFPQFSPDGTQTSDHVQIDVNIGNVDWLTFAYYSDSYEDNVKGLHRTQLMLSLFTVKGYTFSHNYGVKNKETGEIEANNPQQAVELLNRLYNMNLDSSILQNYFKLQEYIRQNLSPEDLRAVYETYIKILDRTRADIPSDLQQFWIDNQEELGLKGKFLPDDSKLKKYAIV